MKEWDYWTWLVYGLIAIAAFMPALGQGIKSEPAFASKFSWITNNRWWIFLPPAFIILATLVLVLHDFGFMGDKIGTGR
jgi:hypothetical protein